MSRSGLTHPRRDMRFSNENVQLLGGNLHGRIFTRRELISRRECYPDFASRQDSRRDPGEEFFSWRDPGEYRFLGRILAEICGGNFSREGSRRENGPPRQDPGGIPVSAGNLGGIPARSRYPFYKGIFKKCLEPYCFFSLAEDALQDRDFGNQNMQKLQPCAVCFRFFGKLIRPM